MYILRRRCALQYNVLVMCLLYAHSNHNYVFYVVYVIEYVWAESALVDQPRVGCSLSRPLTKKDSALLRWVTDVGAKEGKDRGRLWIPHNHVPRHGNGENSVSDATEFLQILLSSHNPSRRYRRLGERVKFVTYTREHR